MRHTIGNKMGVFCTSHPESSGNFLVHKNIMVIEPRSQQLKGIEAKCIKGIIFSEIQAPGVSLYLQNYRPLCKTMQECGNRGGKVLDNHIVFFSVFVYKSGCVKGVGEQGTCEASALSPDKPVH